MATKLYFHDAASLAAGTLPGATSLEVTAGGTAPTWTATGATTNKSMTPTPGSAQASAVGTNNAVTTAQSGWLRRFLSDPLAAQTISIAVNTGEGAALAESNTSSNFSLVVALYVWRPGNGSFVGRLISPTTAAALSSGVTTESWTNLGSGGPTASLTILDGDLLVAELWRLSAAQGMATAYTNTVWYDGTTEGSATSAASYIVLAQTLTFLGGAAALQPPPNIVGQAVQRAAARCVGLGYRRRRSGIWLPDGILVPRIA